MVLPRFVVNHPPRAYYGYIEPKVESTFDLIPSRTLTLFYSGYSDVRYYKKKKMKKKKRKEKALDRENGFHFLFFQTL